MKIIGINNEMYISSACLIVDGKIIAATAEERLTREKRTREFPIKAIQYCLDEAGLKIEEIDFIANSWNPAIYFKKFNPIFSGKRRHLVEQLYSVPDNLMKLAGGQTSDYFYQENVGNFGKIKTYFIPHHRAHAANAFFLSKFDDAAILTADAQGEFESTTFCVGEKNKIKVLDTIDYPHSLGALYSTFTEFLGFRANSDEWKVMAMASYANYDNEYYKIMKEDVVKLCDSGKFELNLNVFNGYMHEQPNLYSDKLIELFGESRQYSDKMEDRHYQIAAALQKISEDISVHLLNHLYSLTGKKNLVLSGGFFMNSVFNGKVISLTPFENLFISSCPDDSGNCFGAATYLYNHILDYPRNTTLEHNYFGPKYSDEVIENELKTFGVPYTKEDNICKTVAELLDNGNIVGWFQGRMEFGQRALGNRSILADPRRLEMKDRVNLAVKFRESFRPFAPAVLKEKQQNYFEIDEKDNIPFMERVVKVKDSAKKKIPAVVHEDGTGRVQTVNKETNKKFYNLIKEFDSITGVPVVLNTSFNLNGEPIVCSPKDAIRTFYSCGLDYLAIGNFLITKRDIND